MSRARRTGLLVGTLALVWAGVHGPAAAQSSGDRRDELRELIGEASAAEAAALAELLDTQERRAALADDVAALDAEVAAAEVRLVQTEALVDSLIVARLEVERALERERARLADAEHDFEGTAAALYKSSGDASRAFASLLLDARDPVQLASGTQYLEQVSLDRQSRVDELVETRDRLEDLAADADEQQANAIAAMAQVESERQELAGLRAQQESQLAALEREAARESEIIASIQERKDEFVAELAALESTSSSITTMLQRIQRGQTRASDLRLDRPVAGPVTSAFGPRAHPILGGTRMHNGVDMTAPYGTPIEAAGSGVVVWAGPRSGYGNTVIIDHGNQYATLYAHASSLAVTRGERVRAGEVVARAGATGLATAPHLHFEVRLLGVPQNPVRFF
ncbi:MAG TPA: peptidoglycan DD-metalloendopeptidase family protein [Acidimicrobiia bacterium]|nr:peptidoglycan DD-metalloendopeptidase family protein [Acidimicrobiia bacterium]